MERQQVRRPPEVELQRILKQLRPRMSWRNFNSLCGALAILAIGVADEMKKGGR